MKRYNNITNFAEYVAAYNEIANLERNYQLEGLDVRCRMKELAVNPYSCPSFRGSGVSAADAPVVDFDYDNYPYVA